MKHISHCRTVFWSVLAFSSAINILPLLIFWKSVRLSPCFPFALLSFAGILIRGIFALVSKDYKYFFVFSKHHTKRFYRYNRPTKNDLSKFYPRATVYFAALPFYVPLMFFPQNMAHSFWILAILLIPQFILIGFDLRIFLLEVKKEREKEKENEREKQAQEKKEELGHWK